ncbi:MAG: nucleotidyltransferase domain-containing protein [Coriobacteriia bacterium]|nr:nucleotidyltransferase domain-containing protein [Coriobacteriia bacterium]
MLTHEQIVQVVEKIAPRVGATRVSYFGSYAQGSATSTSDLDVLVEFAKRGVSFLTLIDFKQQLESELGVPVDVIHSPIPEDAMIEVGKVVSAYDAAA